MLSSGFVAKFSEILESFTEDGFESDDSVTLAGQAVINGSSGSDDLLGHAGNVSIAAANGNDTLDGGPGDDILHGDLGNEELIGGSGTISCTAATAPIS